MSSYPASAPAPRKARGRLRRYMVVAVFLGIAVGVLAIVAVVAVKAADDARDEARRPAASDRPRRGRRARPRADATSAREPADPELRRREPATTPRRSRRRTRPTTRRCPPSRRATSSRCTWS